MKKLFLIVAMLNTACTFAQESFVGKVLYTFHYVYDTKNPTPPLEIPMGLVFSDTESIYKSFVEENINKQYERQINSQEFDGEIDLIGHSNSELDNIYINQSAQQKLICFRHFANQPYEIQATYPKIEWKIDSKKNKTIGKYLCSSATGSFGGRNYQVWFTEELAMPYGPWKLFGLPGLILEAEDASGEIKFIFESIEAISLQEMEDETPRSAIKTTEDKLDQMIEAIQSSNKPMVTDSRKSKSNNYGIPMSNTKITGVNIRPSNQFPTTTNNPLEKKGK